MYGRFDSISDSLGIYKVEIGDAYYAVAGCPIESQDHSSIATAGALKMMIAIDEMKEEDTTGSLGSVMIRAGIHSGCVVAGVVGYKDPRYHLFGSSVHIANAMESEGIPGKLQLSNTTAAGVRKMMSSNSEPTFCDLENRGPIDIPGHGAIECFLASPLQPQLDNYITSVSAR